MLSFRVSRRESFMIMCHDHTPQAYCKALCIFTVVSCTYLVCLMMEREKVLIVLQQYVVRRLTLVEPEMNGFFTGRGWYFWRVSDGRPGCFVTNGGVV